MSQLDHRLFPNNGDLRRQIIFCLGYGVRAPSTHNTQPWLFSVDGNTLRVFADRSRRLAVGDKDGRDLYISLGACVEHLKIAFQYFRMFDELRMGDLSNVEMPVAEFFVHPSSGVDDALRPLIVAIQERFNARGPFLSKKIPDDAMSAVRGMAEGSAEVVLTTDPRSIDAVASLTAEGMRKAHADPAFHRELSRWMTSNYSKRKDGIPGYSMLAPGPLSLMLPWIVGTFDTGPLLAKLNTKAIGSAPAVGVIKTAEDTLRAWLDTGRLFERISLRFNVDGVRTSIYVASVETAELRPKVEAHFAPGCFPQFVFAAGYPKVTLRQSPRLDPLERMV